MLLTRSMTKGRSHEQILFLVLVLSNYVFHFFNIEWKITKMQWWTMTGTRSYSPSTSFFSQLRLVGKCFNSPENTKTNNGNTRVDGSYSPSTMSFPLNTSMLSHDPQIRLVVYTSPTLNSWHSWPQVDHNFIRSMDLLNVYNNSHHFTGVTVF